MPRLIAHSLFCAAAALALYGLAVQALQPAIGRAPSQYLTNRMHIESFVYGSAAETVLTGSSLTRRIPQDALPPGTANIGISAGGALTGLAIVLRSGQRPRRVLFEINKLDEGLDQSLVGDVFAQPLYAVRRRIMAARLTYQPMSVLFNLLRGRRPEADPPVPPETIRKGIERNRVFWRVPVPPPDLAANITLLRSLAAQAGAANIQLVFYEMPVAPELENLPRPAQIRAAVRAAFPPAGSCWLYPRLQGGAHTMDGLHLRVADARDIAAQLRAAPVCGAP